MILLKDLNIFITATLFAVIHTPQGDEHSQSSQNEIFKFCMSGEATVKYHLKVPQMRAELSQRKLKKETALQLLNSRMNGRLISSCQAPPYVS